MKTLSIGAGMVRTPGAIHLDIIALPGIDIVWDLEKVPYPLGDNCWDHVLAKDVLEHLDNIIPCVDELHRILKPGGLLTIRTSYWRSEESFRDPTHKRFCTEETFDYWCPETPLGQAFGYYTKTAYRKKRTWIDHDSLWVELIKLGGQDNAGRIPETEAVATEITPEMERRQGGRSGGKNVEQDAERHGPDSGSGEKVAEV